MLDEKCYQQKLSLSFISHYKESSDEWTNDLEMRAIPALIHGYIKPREKILKILDIGCGSGKDCEYFAKLGNTVIGIDLYSHNNWKSLQSSYKNINFLSQEFLDIDINDKFELILDNGCFHHQHPNNYSSYLCKVNALLNRSGYFVLSTFKDTINRLDIDPRGRLHKYFSDNDLKSILHQSHLNIVNEIDIYRLRKGDYYRVTFCSKL